MLKLNVTSLTRYNLAINDCNVTTIDWLHVVYTLNCVAFSAGHVALMSSISLSPGTGLVLFVISSLPMAAVRPRRCVELVGLKRYPVSAADSWVATNSIVFCILFVPLWVEKHMLQKHKHSTWKTQCFCFYQGRDPANLSNLYSIGSYRCRIPFEFHVVLGGKSKNELELSICQDFGP